MSIPEALIAMSETIDMSKAADAESIRRRLAYGYDLAAIARAFAHSHTLEEIVAISTEYDEKQALQRAEFAAHNAEIDRKRAKDLEARRVRREGQGR